MEVFKKKIKSRNIKTAMKIIIAVFLLTKKEINSTIKVQLKAEKFYKRKHKGEYHMNKDRKNYVGEKNGISLISLIIVIIVIIILAAVVLFTGLGTPDSARFAKYCTQVDDFQTAVHDEYMRKVTAYSTNHQTRSDAQIYYTIATGNEIDTNTKTSELEETKFLADLELDILPTPLEGTEYYLITANANIAGKKDKKGFYDELRTVENHYLTDKGEFFVLPGYQYNSNGMTKWYVTASKYYISDAGTSNHETSPIPNDPITQPVEKYTVAFNSNGGSIIASLADVVKGSTIARPADPVKTGKVFDGWYKESGLSNEFNFASDVINDNTTLYAKWIDETANDLFEWTTAEEIATITGLSEQGLEEYNAGRLTELVIPQRCNGLVVNTIGSNAFYGCSAIKKLVIPDNVTTLNSYCFYNCSGIEEMTVPISLNCSANNGTSFGGIKQLTKVNYTAGTGAGYSYGGYYTCTPWYYSKDHEITVTFAEGITSIGNKMFYSCTGLKTVQYGGGSYTSVAAFKTMFEQNDRTIGTEAFTGTGLL